MEGSLQESGNVVMEFIVSKEVGAGYFRFDLMNFW